LPLPPNANRMKKNLRFLLIGLCIMVAAGVFVLSQTENPVLPKKEKKRGQGAPAGYFEARAMYDLETLKDPNTGKIPRGIFEKEAAFARTIPAKTTGINSGEFETNQTNVNNSYIPAGPLNIG